MRRPEIDHVRKTKSGFVVQTLTREAKKPKSSGVFVSQREPTTQVMCRLSDASCARAHATTLNRATAHGLYSVGQSLLRLQRHYGNHYVQRVVAHFDNQKPKQIRRAEGDPPAPVVIVSGPKKIPKLKEDAAEKLIRSTGAKLEKAGRYRFVPVSGYADFVANAHKRLEAKETASTVLIDGHGGSDADSAWMTMGSATDPNRGWGTTDIGNHAGTLVGADVLKNMRFHSPCEVYLGGCNFAANTPGLKFMQTVANSTGCVTKAYATETTTNPKTGFPEPLSGQKKKKPAKP